MRRFEGGSRRCSRCRSDTVTQSGGVLVRVPGPLTLFIMNAKVKKSRTVLRRHFFVFVPMSAMPLVCRAGTNVVRSVRLAAYALI